ncbi:hypothetical protein DE146DRAFT_605029 [Phaeosphaeria sp. MPI-PUGE-AT-0046c]|nr:hypothetical protein DE146DRAFT_605029 [Phaeosphaeria sp. MPI-PUGE-AT-0046c]
MQRLGSPTPLSAAEAARRKKRRYQSRTDEEIEAEMDNRGLNYRYGWPLLPPLPVKTTRSGAMQAVHNAAGHLDKVQDILHLQRMHSAVAYFAYRVPNNASHDETNEAFLTLVAAVDTTVPGTFVAAVIQLRQYLKTQEDTRDISIELIDHRAIDGLFTSIIRHNDTAILEAWVEISNIVETEISNFQERWLGLQLLRRGLTENRCSPTVVITSPSAGNLAWTQMILPAIRQRLGNLAPLVDLEVLCAATVIPK